MYNHVCYVLPFHCCEFQYLLQPAEYIIYLPEPSKLCARLSAHSLASSYRHLTMASPNVRVAQLALLESSTTFRMMVPGQQKVWLKKLLSFETREFQKPENDEIFKSFEDCSNRLKLYGLYTGCLFVYRRTRKNSDGSFKNANWSCCFYGNESQNKRDLEPRVERNENGERTSARQRDTKNRKLGCNCEFRLSYKASVRNGPKQYIGGVGERGPQQP
jgi:hypothetical protein